MDIKWTQDEWQGCYPSQWKGMIVDGAMAHPAKFSSKLIRRIYEHMLEVGWLKAGDTVIDPFGGIALGALDAMRLGLKWRGVELEAKFVELGGMSYKCPGFSKKWWKRYYGRSSYIQKIRKEFQLCPSCESALIPKKKIHKKSKTLLSQLIPERDEHIYRGNIEFWKHKFSRMPLFGNAELLQGDSRKLLISLQQTDQQGAVSSPPFNESLSRDYLDPEKRREYARSQGITNTELISPIDMENIGLRNAEYGVSDGQLGAMKGDGFESAISSPPFEQRSADGGWQMLGKYAEAGKLTVKQVNGDGSKSYPSWDKERDTSYGESAGQMSAMKATPDGFEAAMKSPPYKNEIEGGGLNVNKPESFRGVLRDGSLSMGSSDGNLGIMNDMYFEAAISSPPFRQAEGGTPEPKPDGVIDNALYARHAAGNGAAEGYGGSTGQLENMEEGDFEGAVSSPPYESTELTYKKNGLIYEGENYKRPYMENQGDESYGDSVGQLGADSGDDFWMAARSIVEQVYLALAPGAHAVWVTKGFVKNKELVDFPDQWRQLCEAVGFVTLHEHRASLVHKKGASHTLEGGLVEHKTESKSFFRRLAEKKGSPKIDYETIWCMEKPIKEIKS